jgi:phosphoribosyl 1,2-cyclic phosphodiesterase
MTDPATVKVRFWGVRGSIACPGPEMNMFGGNTSCVEVTCGTNGDDRGRIILDAGTGIRPLGNALGDMAAPLFPIPMDVMAADRTFNDFRAGETFDVACGATVRTCALNHPGGATGYRIEQDGRAICYVTDTEHVEGAHDETILDLIQRADLFIYDTTYTDKEYPSHVGWGHSTWQEGAALAEVAKVGTYAPFHHDPSHDDTAMAQIEAQAKAWFENTVVAREGLTLTF